MSHRNTDENNNSVTDLVFKKESSKIVESQESQKEVKIDENDLTKEMDHG